MKLPHLPRFSGGLSLEKFKSHGKRLQQEVRAQTLTYFTAALGTKQCGRQTHLCVNGHAGGGDFDQLCGEEGGKVRIKNPQRP